MKLVDLIPLQEIDFPTQKAFDAYSKQHKLRPTTKVKIAGKTTTAGQAAQKSAPVKGTSVFGNETSKTSFKDLKPKQIEKAFDEYMDKNYPKIADKWGDTNGTIDSKTGRFYITTIPKKGGLEVVMFDSVGGNPKEKHYAEAEGPIEKKNWGTAPTLEKAVELYKAAVSSDEWKSVKSK